MEEMKKTKAVGSDDVSVEAREALLPTGANL